MVPPTVDVSSHSINMIKKILHRYAQVIICFIKLIINTDHHIRCDKIDKTSLEFRKKKNKCILSDCVCVVCVFQCVRERRTKGERRERNGVLSVEECSDEAWESDAQGRRFKLRLRSRVL